MSTQETQHILPMGKGAKGREIALAVMEHDTREEFLHPEPPDPDDRAFNEVPPVERHFV